MGLKIALVMMEEQGKVTTYDNMAEKISADLSKILLLINNNGSDDRVLKIFGYYSFQLLYSLIFLLLFNNNIFLYKQYYRTIEEPWEMIE